MLAVGFFLYAGEYSKDSSIPTKGKKLFVFRFLAHLGKISYSLYLVHWPVILIIKRLYPNSYIYNHFGSLVVSLLLSQLLWSKIEKPFQRIQIPTKLGNFDSTLFDWIRKKKNLTYVVPLLMLSLAYFTTYPSNLGVIDANRANSKSIDENQFLKPFANFEAKLIETFNSTNGSAEDTFTADTKISNSLTEPKKALIDLININDSKIKGALKTSKLLPQIAAQQSKIAKDKSSFESTICAGARSTQAPTQCIYTSPTIGIKKKVVLIGDSKLSQFTQPFLEYFLSRNWDVYAYNMNGCNPIDPSNQINSSCTARLDWDLSEEKTRNFDLLIFAGFPSGKISTQQTNFIRDLTIPVKKAILLGVFPSIPNPQLCIGKDLGIGSDCSSIIPNQVFSFRKTNALLASMSSNKTYFLNTATWSCVETSCPTVVDNTFTTRDGTHLTYTYVKKIQPIINLNLDLIINSN